VLLALAVVLLLLLVTPLVVVLLSLGWLHRRNRVARTVPTFAPITWLVLPERPARLHRRLRRSVATARAGAALYGHGARSVPSAVLSLVEELEARACALDGRITVAARAAGPARFNLLNAAETEVAEMEGLAQRVVGLATTWATAAATGRGPAPGVADLAQRLDALDAALREVAEVGVVAAPRPAWAPDVPISS